jgi:hypothetical protein
MEINRRKNIFVVVAEAVYNELPSCIRNNIFLMSKDGVDVILGPIDNYTFKMIVSFEQTNPESTGQYGWIVNETA